MASASELLELLAVALIGVVAFTHIIPALI